MPLAQGWPATVTAVRNRIDQQPAAAREIRSSFRSKKTERSKSAALLRTGSVASGHHDGGQRHTACGCGADRDCVLGDVHLKLRFQFSLRGMEKGGAKARRRSIKDAEAQSERRHNRTWTSAATVLTRPACSALPLLPACLCPQAQVRSSREGAGWAACIGSSTSSPPPPRSDTRALPARLWRVRHEEVRETRVASRRRARDLHLVRAGGGSVGGRNLRG